MTSRLVHERRAATVLYHLLCAQRADGPWLIPANVCPIVPLTLLKAGRPWELVDIEEATLCMDRDAILARVTRAPRPAGVLWVRTYGTRRDFDEFFHELERRAGDTLLVDDRCLLPPRFDEPLAGSVDVALYSTGYGKVLDLGGGGFARLAPSAPYAQRELAFDEAALRRLTADYKRALAERRALLRADGDWLDARPPEMSLDTYAETVAGRLAAALEHKARLNAIYRRELPPEICLDEEFCGWRFQIRVRRKDALLSSIFAHGLFASSHYASLDGVLGAGASARAAALHADVVNLFNDGYYTEAQARATVELVRAHVQTS